MYSLLTYKYATGEPVFEGDNRRPSLAHRLYDRRVIAVIAAAVFSELRCVLQMLGTITIATPRPSPHCARADLHRGVCAGIFVQRG